MAAHGRSPQVVATYRVQLTPHFGFAETTAALPHLAELGISHLYLSPIGTAMPGSTHGYDWVPPAAVAEVLGGIDGLRALRGAARDHGIGILIDIVPNHTGVADALANPWFADVLTHGAASEFSEYFDIDAARDNGAGGKIALPVLAADGDLGPLRIEHGRLVYHDHRFPIAPGTDIGSPTDVHARQHYRLVPHTSGLIGYRRFFTITELAGLRQENPEVFDATHEWITGLIREDLIDGVRVDHPDGLWDPQAYLRDLRALVGTDRLIYIEKILAPDEPLEPSLPVQGTTGYDQLRVIDGVFTAMPGVVELGEIHETITGQPGDSAWLHAGERDRKMSTLREMFRAEHRRLVRTMTHSDPAADSRALEDATAELIAGLGVYRADYPSLRGRLADTIARLTVERPALADALALITTATATPGAPSSRLAQTCGAVTAKSVEDSLFYRTARLVSAQEVGGDPASPSMDLRTFHEHNIVRARDWPLAMTATSTHDTKRGEDVRARIALLTQVPERWSLLVRRIWRDAPPPDDLTGYFLLQNIIGVWPVTGPVDDTLRTRLHDYARKACRESGTRTTWIDVDDEFESAVAAWIDHVIAGRIADDITAFIDELTSSWEQESLARKAVALLGPGVPDIYQGTQWYDDSLVDPDNRRPVDHTRSLDHPKARLIRTALEVRRRHPAAFGTDGRYRPLDAEGPLADHVIAFTRGITPEVALVTARFTHTLAGARSGHDTTVMLPPGTWCDALTRRSVSGRTTLAELRTDAPVAILELAEPS